MRLGCTVLLERLSVPNAIIRHFQIVDIRIDGRSSLCTDPCWIGLGDDLPILLPAGRELALIVQNCDRRYARHFVAVVYAKEVR